MDKERLRDQLVFIAGMPRAGTTFLYHNLQKHPGIYAPKRKEICFFAHNYRHGDDWFYSFYKDKGEQPVALDICGLYFMDENSCNRIKSFNPDAKVILGLRDPAEWIFSLYEHYQTLFEMPDFFGFIDGCTVQREGEPSHLHFEPGFVERAAARFGEAFGDNLMLYDFGILKRDALVLLQRIEAFAGLSPHFNEGNFTNAKINARGRKGSALVDHLLHKRGVANFISAVLPRRLLLSLRSYLDVASVKHLQKAPGRGRQRPAEHVDLASTRFAGDAAFLQRLFSDSPFVEGRL